MKQNLKITHEGQRYVDEPIVVYPKRRSIIEASIAAAFNPRERLRSPITVSHERVKLRWMKPGQDGKLVPR